MLPCWFSNDKKQTTMHEIATHLLDIMIIGLFGFIAILVLAPMVAIVWNAISAAIDIWRGKEVDL